MANLKLKRKENIEGSFFVDSSCIDCGTCYWIAPKVFKECGDQSAVYAQPSQSQEIEKAGVALLSCPTSSIGMTNKAIDLKKLSSTFPRAIAENVFHCGYHHENSFGAASYFIQHPNGNIMIDSPRFVSPLVKSIEKLGGISKLLLTHKDDVADHQKFHEHFGCQRWLHVADVTSQTKDIENKIVGTKAFTLEDDLLMIPVPGHTRGSVVFLYKQKFLFSGDHLAWSEVKQQLVAFRGACWFSWEECTKSMESLRAFEFSYVLPGHGRPAQFDKSKMAFELDRCVEWMKTK